MKLQNISQGKTVSVQFGKNFKGPPFYSGGFPQQQKNSSKSTSEILKYIIKNGNILIRLSTKLLLNFKIYKKKTTKVTKSILDGLFIINQTCV